VKDSLIIHLEDTDFMPLFVVTNDGNILNDAQKQQIKKFLEIPIRQDTFPIK
jgi:hypothetical protein